MMWWACLSADIDQRVFDGAEIHPVLFALND